MSVWNDPFGIYVSNPDADGMIYKLHIPLWQAVLVVMLATFNAIFWGFLGLYAAVTLVI